MRIHKLEIQNIRGITSLTLEPKGKNFLISGPNGTGKSSVVDAIDFLLTGDITHLTGRGTKGISIKKYGSHLDKRKQLEECFVSAEMTLNNKDHFTIKRTVLTPDQLIISDETQLDALNNALTLANEGQHILTRREILSYIATEPSNRAQRILALLNLSNIEDMRQSLVKVVRHFKEKDIRLEGILDAERAQVASILQTPNFNDEILLEFINTQRHILGSEPFIELNLQEIRAGVQYSDERRNKTEGIISLQTELENLKNFTQKQGNQLRSLDFELRQKLISLLTNPELAHALEQHKLTELGIELLDDSGLCPLCEAQWEPVELRVKLETKLQLGEQAKILREEIDSIGKKIAELINFLLSSLRRVTAIASQINFVQEASLRNWQLEIENFLAVVKNLGTEYIKYVSEQVAVGFITPQIQSELTNLESELQLKATVISPEQEAYDRLVQLEQAIRSWKRADFANQQSKTEFNFAQTLQQEFLASRDKVLNDLYEQIRERFEDIYRRLHFEDESSFSATLTPSDAGLNLEVEFYGRGKHPPLALHSEGHQDSMGLCLFLALAEKVARDRMSLIILDDVVMSVDADHRKNLCKVLNESFREFQIIIATHDKTWHHQLRHEGVIHKNDTVEFLSWHIATGPRINEKIDVWEKIDEDLGNNDISAAAHKLRRWAEMYFAEVCERLGAKVLFRQDARWDLGDLLHPAIHRWKELNRKATNTANSWDDGDKRKELVEIGDQFGKAVERTQAEQWIINPLVHYNSWLDLSKHDFASVSEAFKDLTDYFECPKCGKMLSLDNIITPKSLQCSCSKTNWNLKMKDEK